MKVKVLGTQSPVAGNGHNCPGFCVQTKNANILLDCGSGTHSLMKMPAQLKNLHIIISHLHLDHCSDVFNYQNGAYMYNRLGMLNEPINIYLPATPERQSVFIRGEEFSFAEYRVISADTELTIDGCAVSFCATAHPIETYAVKLRYGEKTVVYTADTSIAAHDALVGFAKNADLLIAESSLLAEHNSPAIATHLTAGQAGLIAKNAQVKTLMLTHFWQRESVEKYLAEARQNFRNVIPAIEGQEHAV